MSKHETRVPVDVVKYAAAVADVLKNHDEHDGSSQLMQVYVTEVRFGCEGDDVPDVRVVPDEFGGYELVFGNPAVTPGGSQ